MNKFKDFVKTLVGILGVVLLVVSLTWCGWKIKSWGYQKIYGLSSQEEVEQLKEEVKVLKIKVENLEKVK